MAIHAHGQNMSTSQHRPYAHHMDTVDLVCLVLVAQFDFANINRSPLQTTKNLTDAQVQDLLHLRRMFYGRLGQLMRHRKQLLSQVPKTGLHPSGSSNSDAAGTDQLAQQLKTSGADEYQAYTTFASVFFRGVSVPQKLMPVQSALKLL